MSGKAVSEKEHAQVISGKALSEQEHAQVLAAGKVSPKRWIALGVTCLAGVLASIQSSSLIVALVELVQALNATFANIIWVLLAFMLAVGAVSPVLGFFSDSGLKGVRCKLFNFGFAIFGVASLLCGFAQPQYSAIDLIVYRAVMGVGAGFIFSNSAPILADKFHASGQMGLAQGIWQIAFAVGSVVGPVVGGVLLEAGWPWIFWFNVPFCVVGCVLGFWQVRDEVPAEVPGHKVVQITFAEVMKKFDYFGAFLLLTSIIFLFIAIVASIFPTPELGQTAAIAFGTICGVFALVFIGWDYYRRNNHPFVNFKLFNNRTFALCAFGNVATSLARGGLTFSFIFLYQGPYGCDALQAGINVIPFGVGMILGGLPSGRIGDLYGYKKPSIIGPLVSALGLIGAAFIRPSTNYWITALYLFFAGLGGGIYNSPTTALMMLSIKPTERGQSSGLRMMMSMIANAFSIIICFDLIVGNLSQALVYKLFIVGGGGLDESTLQPFMNGFHAVIWIVVAMNVLASLCSLPLKDLKRPKTPHPSTGRKDSATQASIGLLPVAREGEKGELRKEAVDDRAAPNKIDERVREQGNPVKITVASADGSETERLVSEQATAGKLETDKAAERKVVHREESEKEDMEEMEALTLHPDQPVLPEAIEGWGGEEPGEERDQDNAAERDKENKPEA